MNEQELIARLRAAGCVFAEDEARLLRDAAVGVELATLLERRVAGEPLEKVLGWVKFSGLQLNVAPGVFVPRRRTEALAIETVRLSRAAARASAGPQPVTVVDLCCGVGAIAAVVQNRVPDVRIFAADIDANAIAVACDNLPFPNATVVIGDLFDALPVSLRAEVNVLAVNAPYVPTADIGNMPRESREYEALIALDGGEDGLDVQRRVAAGAIEWMAPGGHVLIETSSKQARSTRRLLTERGLKSRTLTDPTRDATVVIGRFPG